MSLDMRVDGQTSKWNINLESAMTILFSLTVASIIFIAPNNHAEPILVGLYFPGCTMGGGLNMREYPPNFVTVDFDDTMRWNGELVNPKQLNEKMKFSSALSSYPDINITTNPLASYQAFASVLTSASENGIDSIILVQYSN
ncbi:MAG: biopolymer transporter ExbD [Undibacterium sp.]|nr:biopolymer transporter ExbD [Undibacterium sp.]